MSFTAVFGSVFVDIKGYPSAKYIPTGRNVGEVAMMHGGVCRNVAENIANIGCPVALVTMLEDSAIGDDIRRRLIARGVDLNYAVNAPSGIGKWLAVFDERGELAGSISAQPDFSTMEALVDSCGEAVMQACEAVVLEIDTKAEIADKVFALAEKYHKDVYVVVGNMSVILKRPDLLPKTRLFIMNEIEGGSLFGCTLDKHEPEKVLRIVRDQARARGIREMVVTLGACGAVYYDAEKDEGGCIPAEDAQLVDSTGAGDAFFSGTVAARMRGYSLRDAACKGTHLAALTIRTEESTCPQIADLFDE